MVRGIPNTNQGASGHPHATTHTPTTRDWLPRGGDGAAPARSARDEAIHDLEGRAGRIEEHLFIIERQVRAHARAEANLAATRAQVLDLEDRMGTFEAQSTAREPAHQLALRQEIEAMREQNRALEDTARRDAGRLGGLERGMRELTLVVATLREAMATTPRKRATPRAAPRASSSSDELDPIDEGSDGGGEGEEGGEEGDDEPEEEDDTMSSVSAAGRSAPEDLKIHFFNSSEIASMTCDMSRKKITIKLVEIRDALEERHERIAELLDAKEAVYRTMVKTLKYKAADAYIRRTCRACIAADGVDVTIWRAQEAELRRVDPEEAKLGRMMLERMVEFGTLKDMDDVRAMVKRLNSHEYLKTGLDKRKAYAAALDMRADWAMLPKNERASFDLLRLLCKKVPDSYSEDSMRSFGDRLQDELDEKERRGDTLPTFDVLANVIAGRIGKSHTGGSGTALVTTRNGPEACYNCKDKKCEGFEKCKERCKTAKAVGLSQKGCPCIFGQPCPLLENKLPERKDLKGVSKSGGLQTMTERTYERVGKNFKAYKAAAGKTAAMAAKEDEADSSSSQGGLAFVVSSLLPSVQHTAHAVMMLKTIAPQPVEGGVQVRFLLDTGADTAITVVAHGLGRHAASTEGGGAGIGGLGGAAKAQSTLTFEACLAGAPKAPFTLTTSDIDDAALDVCIISYAELRELCGCYAIRLEPEMVAIWADGSTSRVYRQGRHYFIDIVLAPTREQAVEAAGEGMMTTSTALTVVSKGRSNNPAFMQAVRLGVDASTLQTMEGCVVGLKVGKISPETTVMINNEEGLRRTRHKRRSAGASLPGMHKSGNPAGHTFVLDGWHASVACSFTKHMAVMHAFDSVSTYGYCLTAAGHGFEEVTRFAEAVVRREAALEPPHIVRVFKMDALQVFKDFSCDDKKTLFEKRTGAVLDRGAGDDHEFLGVGESCMRPITIRTEAAMFRARAANPPVPDGWMVKCRIYQVQVWNICLANGSDISRLQAHTRQVPSLTSSPMPCFYTRCSVHALSGQRGPKGLMDEARSSRERTGRVVGFKRTTDGKGQVELIADDTGQPITRVPTDLDSLDEHIIATAGLAAGTAQTDAKLQCDLEDLPKLQPIEPTAAPQPKPPKVVTEYVLPTGVSPEVGDAIQVLWQDAKGDTYKYHEGKVIERETYEDGTERHLVEYESWEGDDKTVWHDLAKEQATGKHSWRKAKAKAAQPAPAKPPAAQPTKKGGRGGLRSATAKQGEQQTRSAQLAAQQKHWLGFITTLDEAMENAPDPAELFSSTCYLALGPTRGAKYDVDNNGGDLGKASLRLYKDVMTGDMLVEPTAAVTNHDVYKAGKAIDVVKVTTESGEVIEYKVPKSHKDVLDAADSIEWLQAETSALYDSILSLPHHSIMAMEDALKISKEEGIPIARMVTTYIYKMEGGKIKKRKVRHSVDENRLYRMVKPAMREILQQYCTHTQPVGEMEMNLFLADIEDEDYFALLDWKDAYGLGESARGLRLVHGPEGSDLRTPDGRKGVLALGCSGLWGEGAAGFEFEVVKDEDMLKAGWPRIKEVPAYYTRPGPERSVGCSIIDDLGVRSRNPQYVHTLHEYLSGQAVKRGGQPLTIEVSPTKWGGMKIWRDPERQTITVSMPDFIIAATFKWLPTLVNEGALPAGIPTGKKLRDALDALEVAEGAGKLTQEQSDVQALAGVLRWIVRRVYRIIKAAHMLACVAHRAKCPEAKLAALGVLACAYEARDEGQTYHRKGPSGAFGGVLKGTYDARRDTKVLKADGEARTEHGAPLEQEGISDATWSKGGMGTMDVYTYGLTYKCAGYFVQLKKSPVVGGSSAELEGLGLLKVSDATVYSRIVAAKLGIDTSKPTMLLCDAEAALRAASGEASCNRLKHAVRRSAIVFERVQAREIALAHIPDAANAVDIFTKWCKADKVEAMLAYLTGGSSAGSGAYVNTMVAAFAVLADWLGA